MATYEMTRTTTFVPEISLPRQLRWAISDTLVITRRNLTHYLRQPQLIALAVIQPIMFVLLFAYVFGGAIQTPGGDYINYLLPGIIIQTAIMGATQTTTGLADDLSKGMVDRLRSLPMSRAAVLAGRTLADTVRSLFSILIMIGVGFIIGFNPDGSLPAIIGAISLTLAFSYAFTWISAWIGLLVENPEAAQVAGFIWVFPLVFASSIFVPTQTMPELLKVFAENQPISQITDVVRGLFMGQSVDFLPALLSIVGILVIFLPLAVWQYNRRV